MPSSPPIRRDPRTGVYFVLLDTPHGQKRITTGERTRNRAASVCDAALIDKLQMAAKAGVLNANAISVLTTGRKFTCADVVEAWKADATIDLAPDTLNGYSQTLALFMAQDDIRSNPIAMVTRLQLDQFVNAPDTSKAARRHRLAVLRNFFSFANAEAYCVGNPAVRLSIRQRDLEFHQIEHYPRLPVTHEEYLRIMGSDRVDGFYRWATALAYWLGLRIRDVACMEWASLQEDRIVVHTKKTGQRVALPLDNPLIGSGDLKHVIAEIKDEIPAEKRDPVYCFPKERALALSTTKRATLSCYYARVLKRCGVDGKSFHGLRRAFADRLDVARVSIEQIGELMGHSSTTTTEIYLSQKQPAA